MRAWIVHHYGHYREVLSLESVGPPKPDADSCVIEVMSAGVMYADLLNIAGQYQVKAPLPFVPGSEGAGVVVEAGERCPYRPGDRVVTVNLMGAFAERMLCVDQVTHRIPDAMPFADAAAFTINYQTAYFALIHRAGLRAAEWVLVHGGAGGVGTATIQLAKALGANVMATASGEDKLAVCRQCGADYTVNYQSTDFVAAVKDITGGHGADVIVDPVGGDVFDASSKCIAFEGRLIIIGFASGRIPEIAANRILLKNISVVGLFWGSYQTRNNELVRQTQNELYRLYSERKIKPVIHREYPLEELPAALNSLESRTCIGKPVLSPAR